MKATPFLRPLAIACVGALLSFSACKKDDKKEVNSLDSAVQNLKTIKLK